METSACGILFSIRKSQSAVRPVAYGSAGAFQSFTVPSKLAEAIHCPSGLKATLLTQLVWPCRLWISFVNASQTFTVASVLPQASRGARVRPEALLLYLAADAHRPLLAFTRK